MIRTHQTYECDSCHRVFAQPANLARLELRWGMQWDKQIVDLCEQCVTPIKDEIEKRIRS